MGAEVQFLKPSGLVDTSRPNARSQRGESRGAEMHSDARIVEGREGARAPGRASKLFVGRWRAWKALTFYIGGESASHHIQNTK